MIGKNANKAGCNYEAELSMRILFRILTTTLLLFSLFSLIVPIVIMFAKESVTNWRGYVRQGLEDIPEGLWNRFFGHSSDVPFWLILFYWIMLLLAVAVAWKPSHKNDA